MKLNRTENYEVNRYLFKSGEILLVAERKKKLIIDRYEGESFKNIKKTSSKEW